MSIQYTVPGFERESPPITTRPGLLQIFTWFVKGTNTRPDANVFSTNSFYLVYLSYHQVKGTNSRQGPSVLGTNTFHPYLSFTCLYILPRYTYHLHTYTVHLYLTYTSHLYLSFTYLYSSPIPYIYLSFTYLYSSPIPYLYLTFTYLYSSPIPYLYLSFTYLYSSHILMYQKSGGTDRTIFPPKPNIHSPVVNCTSVLLSGIMPSVS